MDNYSLSDLAAVTSENGFGGNSAWVFLLFFAMIYGGGGFFGNRQGELSQYATAASQQEILFGQQFQGLNTAINKVGDGLASLGYSQLQTMDNMTAQLGNAITTEGRAIQTQLANCCCDNIRNTDSVRYDMANFAAAINANIDNKFAAIEKQGLEQRIAEQAAQINQLQMAQAMAGVPRMNFGWNVSPCGCGCGNNF